MSISGYSQKCEELAVELLKSLSTEDTEGLKDRLMGVDIKIWHRWVKANEIAISKIISQTPSQRKKNKIWVDEETRWLATLAAIHRCLHAQAFLQFSEENLIESGWTYREMASRAGLAFEAVRNHRSLWWPFEGKSPFSSKRKKKSPEA